MRTFVHLKGLLFCALLVLAQSVTTQHANAQNFEGRIVYSMSSPMTGGEKIELISSFKNDKIVSSVSLGAMGSMKMYFQGTKLTTVMGSMGFETELKPSATKTVAGNTPKITQTGKKETINGYAAEEWVATIEGKGTMTMWLSSDFDRSIVEGMKAMNRMHQAQQPNDQQAEITRIIAEKGLMPVRVTMSADGEQVMSMDLVKIEKTSIPDSEFVVPSDVTIQKMDPNMMQQMD